MKILLTGASGQVGFELARSLQGLGHIIAPSSAECNLADIAQLRRTVSDIKPDLIINPAAYTQVDKAESEAATAQRINAEAVAVLAEAAAQNGVPLIHYSTDYVFDGTKNGAYLETDATAPVSVYGASKLAGEEAIRASGAAHLILRTSWVYGMRGKNFLLTMLRLSAERDELRIVDDQIGAPTWCRTLADVTAHLIARSPSGLNAKRDVDWWREQSGVYHLTAQGATSWHGFTAAILRLSGNTRCKLTPINSSEYPSPAKRPANSRLDCGKIQAAFGLTLPAWEHSLQLCLAQ